MSAAPRLRLVGHERAPCSAQLGFPWTSAAAAAAWGEREDVLRGLTP